MRFFQWGGYRGKTLIGGCRERVTSCSGFLEPTNYESVACSYSGLYQGQALHSPARTFRLTELVGYGWSLSSIG